MGMQEAGKPVNITRKMEALARMEADPDIVAEMRDANAAADKLKGMKLPDGHPEIKEGGKVSRCPFARLNVVRTSHTANAETRQIVRDLGGLPVLRRFTNRFYEKAFLDPHLDQFIQSHDEPHGERFACWIAEKMGDGSPWTAERSTREVKTFVAYGQKFRTAHDRSSAHFAAWHSPKRDPSDWGEHFKLDSCRVWMRLHFWAAREVGVLDHPAFADYYCKLIGHFVSVYEGTAPPFARESMRWSADENNIKRYLANGRRMPEIMGLSTRAALAALPLEERDYTGSKQGTHWPYA